MSGASEPVHSSPANANLNVDLTGRTVVITGGASGIGYATALLMRRSGADVFVGDLRLNPQSTKDFELAGIVQQECDVQQLNELQRLIDTAAAQTGRLDILVNNAGVNLVKQVTEVEESEWDHVLSTNLKAAFFGAKYAIPHLIRAGGGSIINTASNAGLLPRAHDPVYSISKQALVGLTKSLALCHSKDRIRVNCVCPGPVENTQMMTESLQAETDIAEAHARYIQASPLARAHRRMISPDEVAAAILYLISDAAAMVTGTAIAIDGGKSLCVPPAVR